MSGIGSDVIGVAKVQPGSPSMIPTLTADHEGIQRVCHLHGGETGQQAIASASATVGRRVIAWRLWPPVGIRMHVCESM